MQLQRAVAGAPCCSVPVRPSARVGWQHAALRRSSSGSSSSSSSSIRASSSSSPAGLSCLPPLTAAAPSSRPSSQCGTRLRPVCSAAAGALPAQPAPAQPPAAPLGGIKLLPAAAAVGVGLALYYLVPTPTNITSQAWAMLSIFLSTIMGLVLGPLPVGAWAFCGLTATVATGTLPFKTALSAMTNEVIWLIVISFFFAKGIEKTGLGERIANIFVAAMGQSTLGLAYGLAIAEFFVSPALPSTTARAGGIFMPIIKFLSKNMDGEPEQGGRKKIGAFLVQSQLQQSSYSSAVFLTSGAQNLLCLDLAAKLGVVVQDAWMTWFIGALPQTIVGMALCTWLLYKVYPPEITETPEAPKAAKERLAVMGPMQRNELIMLATIGGAVVLWMCGEALGCSAVLAAMLALVTLLCTGVLTWKDCLDYGPAWDTLTWFAILVSMASALNEMGLISAFANLMGSQLSALNLGWQPVFFILHFAFFSIHYLFAGQTAHIGALYAAFLAMMLAAGVPGLLAVLSLAYNGNLFGGITQFASGQAAIYYGSGYNTLPEWFWLGAVFGYLSLIVYIVGGWPWWKFLGWF